jgi:hypothetical protein
MSLCPSGWSEGWETRLSELRGPAVDDRPHRTIQVPRSTLLLSSQRVRAGKLPSSDYLSYRLGLRTFSEAESSVRSSHSRRVPPAGNSRLRLPRGRHLRLQAFDTRYYAHDRPGARRRNRRAPRHPVPCPSAHSGIAPIHQEPNHRVRTHPSPRSGCRCSIDRSDGCINGSPSAI